MTQIPPWETVEDYNKKKLLRLLLSSILMDFLIAIVGIWVRHRIIMNLFMTGLMITSIIVILIIFKEVSE